MFFTNAAACWNAAEGWLARCNTSPLPIGRRLNLQSENRSNQLHAACDNRKANRGLRRRRIAKQMHHWWAVTEIRSF